MVADLFSQSLWENKEANSWQSQDEHKPPIPDMERAEPGPERTKALRHNDNQAEDNDHQTQQG